MTKSASTLVTGVAAETEEYSVLSAFLTKLKQKQVKPGFTTTSRNQSILGPEVKLKVFFKKNNKS